MNEGKAWESVLGTLFCQKGRLRAVRHNELRLPPYMRGQFSAYLYRVPQGELVAVQAHAWSGRETVEELLGAVARFQAQFDKPCVLLVGNLPAPLKQRYVSGGVPFVSSSQVAFIPGYFAQLGSLRPTLPPQADKVNTHGQLTLLRHFLFGDVSGKPLRRVAELLHCQAIQISRGKDSLCSQALCSFTGRTRGASFTLPKPTPELWERALGALSTPVVRTLYLKRIPKDAPLAGESALSCRTLLSAPPLPCHALGKAQAARIPASQILPDAYGAAACVQVWRYNPTLLMQRDDDCVDPLSLYLSLMNDADERIQQELTSLPMPWTAK